MPRGVLRRSGRLPRVLGVLSVTIGLLALTTSCSSGGSGRAAGAARQTVQVSVSNCGKGWQAPAAGRQAFTLHNTDTRPGSADLVDVRTGKVYAEIEPLAAGTSAGTSAALPDGHFAWRCYMEDESVVTGPTVVLRGPAGATTPGVRPISAEQLIPQVQAYQRYVTARLPELLRRVTVLDRDVQHGRLAAARRAWLPAHLAYLGVGGAYGAFGTADAAIDGLADGLPGGVRDPHWHGLHRVEYGLWHGQSSRQLGPVADRLVADVQSLQRSFAHDAIDPLQLGIRTHEITEDALRFALTGRDDYGSHTTLDTLLADDGATRVLLRIVAPVLKPRYGGTPAIEACLARSTADIERLRGRHGELPALAALNRHDRELIDSDTSQLAEDLAPVATVLEPRRTS